MIASTLIAIWAARFIPQLQRITKIGIVEGSQAREAMPSYMNVISFGPLHVARLEMLHSKSGAFDQLRNWTVEMASAREPLP